MPTDAVGIAMAQMISYFEIFLAIITIWNIIKLFQGDDKAVAAATRASAATNGRSNLTTGEAGQVDRDRRQELENARQALGESREVSNLENHEIDLLEKMGALVNIGLRDFVTLLGDLGELETLLVKTEEYFRSKRYDEVKEKLHHFRDILLHLLNLSRSAGSVIRQLPDIAQALLQNATKANIELLKERITLKKDENLLTVDKKVLRHFHKLMYYLAQEDEEVHNFLTKLEVEIKNETKEIHEIADGLMKETGKLVNIYVKFIAAFGSGVKIIQTCKNDADLKKASERFKESIILLKEIIVLLKKTEETKEEIQKIVEGELKIQEVEDAKLQEIIAKMEKVAGEEMGVVEKTFREAGGGSKLIH